MLGSHCHWLNEIPDLLALADRFPSTFPFLLDSSARGNPGAHSLLLFAGDDLLVRQPDGSLKGPGAGSSFFDRLESWYRAECAAQDVAREPGGCEIPFIGGWFLFLGYEAASEIETRLILPANGTGLPDAFAWRCPGAIIVFHEVAGEDSAGARAAVIAETPYILAKILRHLHKPEMLKPWPMPALRLIQADRPEKFLEGVRRIHGYLRDGDTFQVNLSRQWSGQFSSPPHDVSVYSRLRASNPAPFAGLMRWQSWSLLSSSPERLVKIRGREIQTRPIAGTRPRGADYEQDMALSRELIENIKERAEHIMLIDLERNDLGRVCEPGTVKVDELMVVESYAHVHHIVSNVRGELTADANPVTAIKAVFPGGTITGCPKVRCMEIIAELEQVGRGFYTGSMGYLGRNGSLDLNILIRTMMLRGENVSFRTGAGIVADSDARRELQETEDKAAGLLLALQPEGREIGVA